jgi:uncharacterized protein YbjQ (UPF0145 family)
MSKFCVDCGRDLGGLTGAAEESLTRIETLRQWEVDVPSPICAACFGRILERAQSEMGDRLLFPHPPSPQFLETARIKSRAIELYTYNPYPPGACRNLGVVTAHAVIGTGPLATLASALSDVLGQVSQVYADKLSQAEYVCLDKIRGRASRLGADAIVGLKTSWQELTSGHGMLLVAMIGTAVARTGGSGDPL